jgi:uncharacterized protein YdiU (UPF0061 family)
VGATLLTGPGWNWDNTYARLPEDLFSPATPAVFRNPAVALVNHRLAQDLGLDFSSFSEEDLADLFAGQALPGGTEPIAQAYAGHQFGHPNMLGDGRAILLGEHLTPAGQRYDIQLKGPGPTRFSRGGDGLAALGPMLREYLISEAMQALGIPTTRSLAVVTTGERIFRQTYLPGAVLTRVAASHIRVGTFQYVAARRKPELLQTFTDYTIARHFPELVGKADRYPAFLRAVIDRQADLIARWQLVGFVHGVMNTDNMAISGETIDYGPCAFLDTYHPEMVFSSIDHDGRYAYGNQPAIAQWNLARFAETILPLLHDSEEQAIALATDALHAFAERYHEHWLAGMRRKLGLVGEDPGDEDLIQTFLKLMADHQADFTNTFRNLATIDDTTSTLIPSSVYLAWRNRWQARRLVGQTEPESRALMNSANPVVIPRNHRVEAALTAASESGNLGPIQDLLAVLSSPFSPQSGTIDYTEPPPASAPRYRTFCGT